MLREDRVHGAQAPYRVHAIAGIQARMGSSRLPGKSMADLAGVPMIRRVYERARAARGLDAVVVLTTVLAIDDPLAAYCEQEGIPFRRGPEQDVFARYIQLMDEFDPRYLVRVTGDCPFISPEHIDAQLQLLEERDADSAHAGAAEHIFAGQGALSTRALRAAAHSTDPADREHVGSFYLAQNAAQLRAIPVPTASFPGSEGLRLCVDEPTDLQAARNVYEALAPRWGSLIPIEEAVAFMLADEGTRALALAGNPSAANRRLLDLKARATVEVDR